MGAPPDLAQHSIRVSFGWNSVPADADAVIASLLKLRQRVRAPAAA
jgi:cysteine sulfinate desulfinase/cysteine desulfurase-like protein